MSAQTEPLLAKSLTMSQQNKGGGKLLTGKLANGLISKMVEQGL